MKPIVILLLAIVAISCGDSYEWSEFEEIPLEVDGIKLTKGDGLFTYEATLPPSGGMFGVRPEEKYQDVARYILIETNREMQTIHSEVPEKAPFRTAYPLISEEWGTWGEITYYYNVSPYVIMFDIEPNVTDEPRRFSIEIGAAYSYTKLKITQLPADQ